jgi:hypothetical protein
MQTGTARKMKIRPNEVIESSSRLWGQSVSVDAGYLVCLTCFVELD